MRQEYLILVSIIGLRRGLSLIGIGAIWLLSFICLLRRIIASFLPEFHKKYKSRFIASSSSCTTTEVVFLS